MDLKTILGFNDKEKLEVSGDIFVQKVFYTNVYVKRIKLNNLWINMVLNQ